MWSTSHVTAVEFQICCCQQFSSKSDVCWHMAIWRFSRWRPSPS